MAIIVGNNQGNVIDGTLADEVILAGGGSDTVNAGGGDDTIDGGEGSDVVFAGSGNDTVIHVEGDNLDAENWYFGEKGMDTLRLVVSAETLVSDEFQDELATFQAMIDADGSAEGYFSTLGIYFSSFEAIEVVSDNLPPQSPVPGPVELGVVAFENDEGAIFVLFTARDPEGGALTFEVSDDRFEVVPVTTGSIPFSLKLKDGISLDHETEPDVAVVVTMTDPGGLSTSRTFNLDVHDAAPTAIALDNASVDENVVGAEVGNLIVTDPDGDTEFVFSVNDLRFEVVDGVLKLVDGESLDFEDEPTVSVAVTAASDSSSFSAITEIFDITVNDVNEAPRVYRPTDAAESLVIGELIPAISILDPELAEELIQEFGNPRSENAPGTYFGLLVATDYTGNQLPVELSDSRFEPVPITEFISPDTELPPQLEADLEAALGADWPTLYLVKLLVSEVVDYETEPTVSMTATATGASGTTSTTLDFEVEDVNEVPTAIALDNNSVDENAAGAEIGNLTVTDPDGDTTFDFLVDDARFEVVDGTLKLVDGESLDFEDEPTVSLNVTATDGGGLSVTESFDIDVADVNEAPQIVRIAPGSLVSTTFIVALIGLDSGLAPILTDPGAENSPGAAFGLLTASDPDGEPLAVDLSDSRFEAVSIVDLLTPGVELPPEAGSVFSGVYVVKLKDDQMLDHEAEPSVPLTATVTDAGGLTASTTFDVGVQDVNEAPQIVRPIAVEAALVAAVLVQFPELGLAQFVIDPGFENTPGDTFGILQMSDPDGDALTVEISDSRFEAVPITELATPGAVIPPELETVLSTIYVVKLKDDQTLDHEAEPSVPLTATVTDAGNLTASTSFVVGVEDVNEAPTAIVLDGTSIVENEPGAVVGAVTVTNPDGDLIFDYEVSDDRFEVVGGVLKLKDAESLDFGTSPTVALDVTASDPGNLSFTQAFDIDVIDVPEVAV